MDADVLKKMLEISRRMAETRVLDPLLDYAVGEALNLVGAERGYLVLLNENGSLDFRVKRDRDGNTLDDSETQISRTILNQVVTENKPLVLTDAITDPNFSASVSVTLLQLRSVMCVPLVSRGVTIGALYVENRSETGIFEPEDLTPLIFFSNQAAVSIENAMLNDDLEARVAARTAELKQATDRLEHSWLEAVEANRMRTIILGNLAHDLRAPLSILIGALYMLDDGTFGELNEEQDEWVKKSIHATNLATQLTNDVFDLTRMEMGKLTIYPEKEDLNEFLEKTYSVARGLPWDEGVEFRSELGNHLPMTVFDKTRIQQVIFNLLTNARKFTTEGYVTLYARYLANEQVVLIGVRDTGPGIPEHEIPHLFERFHQASTDKAHRKMGTGLGLAICRELVTLHQGQIRFERPPDKGSDFQFTLPVIEKWPDSPPEEA